MPIPDDAHYVAGTGRRTVRLGNGETVSRARAENVFAQSMGFRNNYDLKTSSAGYRAGLNARGKRLFDQNMREARNTGGREGEKRAAALAVKLGQERRQSGRSGRQTASHRPGSTLDKFLVETGRRGASDVPVNVGDSA